MDYICACVLDELKQGIENQEREQNKEESWRSYTFKQNGHKCITLLKILVVNHEVCKSIGYIVIGSNICERLPERSWLNSEGPKESSPGRRKRNRQRVGSV